MGAPQRPGAGGEVPAATDDTAAEPGRPDDGDGRTEPDPIDPERPADDAPDADRPAPGPAPAKRFARIRPGTVARLAPWVAAVAAAVALLLLGGTPVAVVARFAGYWTLWIAVPGVLVWRLVAPRW